MHLRPLSSVVYESTGCHFAPRGPAVSVLPELLATIRCARLAAGLPVIWRFCRQDGHEILAKVDEVVMPLVDKTIGDPHLRDWIRGAFQTAAIKFGAGVWGYSAMAGRPADLGLIALSTSFTRLYDDLMDHGADETLDDRFEQLVEGRRPAAAGDLEQLMQELFLAIESAAQPSRPGQFYTDVAEVHRWQRRSRRQRRDRSITSTELREITRGKGSLGVLVLYTLGRDEVPDDERELIRHIGAVGQMLDDQHDLPIDRQDGIATPATCGHVGAWKVGGEVARLGAQLRQHFGARRARSFGSLLFLYQAGLIFRRERMRRTYPPIAATPWRILIGRTRDIAFDDAGDTPLAESVVNG